LANNTTLGEADGSARDWVEIYNPSSVTVDLNGMGLTESAASPLAWIFPAGSILPAQGFLRILCSSELPASSTNTGFGLSTESGALYLFNAAGQGGGLQSSITYGLQAADWSIGRVPDGSSNWVLNIPTPGMANSAASLGNTALLKVNEWMADPASGQDWFEIFNPNPEPAQISGLWLSDEMNDRDKTILPPLSFIGNGARAFQRFQADELPGADHVAFKLGAGGDAVLISYPTGALIDAVSFGGQSRGVSQGRLLDGGASIVSFPISASPGSANYLPLQTVVVNEVLTHTDPPLMDAVEFFNPTANPVTIGGWFLSDSANNLRKYQIPEGVVVPAGSYAVVYEDDFNGDAAGEPFSFSSASGDEVYLSEAVNGLLSGYRAAAEFGAAENGVSFGRFATSVGFDFVPMSGRTFGRDNPATSAEFKLGTGALNAAPKVGPIVISEIMFHPPGTNDALEFVELHNVSAGPVTLQHPLHAANTWRLRKGVEFEFPSGIVIPAGGWLVVVSFDPMADPASRAIFQQAYGSAATLVGPYRGKLSNGGDVIELQKPDAPQLDGSVPYVMVDRISYSDVAPWPTQADGLGSSLQKVNRSRFGNDPANWIAAAPTPGPLPVGDNDADGMPNDWETLYGLNPNGSGDALLDNDGDGLLNLHEFLAGTNPNNSADALRLSAERAGADTVLSFNASGGRSYVLFYSDSAAGPWQELEEIPSGFSTVVRVTDPGPRAARRFYLLRVELQQP
ncbi:MAG: lamin tail domain-containing protein, partial [Limisphaerales bacterium]